MEQGLKAHAKCLACITMTFFMCVSWKPHTRWGLLAWDLKELSSSPAGSAVLTTFFLLSFSSFTCEMEKGVLVILPFDREPEPIDLSSLPSWPAHLGSKGKLAVVRVHMCLKEMASKPWHQSMEKAGGDV